MTPLLRYADAARLLGVHEETVKTYVRRGELAAVRLGRRVLFREDDIAAFIAARRVGPRHTIVAGASPTSPVPAVWDIGARGRKGQRSA
jgi:excisionase family DNA binding protein